MKIVIETVVLLAIFSANLIVSQTTIDDVTFSDGCFFLRIDKIVIIFSSMSSSLEFDVMHQEKHAKDASVLSSWYQEVSV